MGEYEDLPTVISRVSLDNILEPVNLFLVDSNFVGSELGFAEDGGSQTNQQCLLSDLANELRRWFSVCSLKELQIGLVCVELVNSLKILTIENRGKAEFQRAIVSNTLQSLMVGSIPFEIKL